jgi:COP9 signalosome complex subunit 7
MSPSAGADSGSDAHLEQFLLLAKDTSGKATAAVIQQVLRNRHVFVFGELIDLPAVAQVCTLAAHSSGTCENE